MRLSIRLVVISLCVVVSCLHLVALASAAHLKGSYPACLTEELLDEFTSAVVNKDERQFNYLLKNGCIIAKSGVPISILDRGWTISKVRVYVGDTSIILWTYNENIVQ